VQQSGILVFSEQSPTPFSRSVFVTETLREALVQAAGLARWRGLLAVVRKLRVARSSLVWEGLQAGQIGGSETS